MDEKLRFLEEKRLARTIEAEREAETKIDAAQGKSFAKTATNPIASAFLRFVHTKHKFNIKDL